jgi:hypothetical protein
MVTVTTCMPWIHATYDLWRVAPVVLSCNYCPFSEAYDSTTGATRQKSYVACIQDMHIVTVTIVPLARLMTARPEQHVKGMNTRYIWLLTCCSGRAVICLAKGTIVTVTMCMSWIHATYDFWRVAPVVLKTFQPFFSLDHVITLRHYN